LLEIFLEEDSISLEGVFVEKEVVDFKGDITLLRMVGFENSRELFSFNWLLLELKQRETGETIGIQLSLFCILLKSGVLVAFFKSMTREECDLDFN
jgi:hypothetical protein